MKRYFLKKQQRLAKANKQRTGGATRDYLLEMLEKDAMVAALRFPCVRSRRPVRSRVAVLGQTMTITCGGF